MSPTNRHAALASVLHRPRSRGAAARWLGIATCVIAASVMFAPLDVSAQGFPSKPVRLIVPVSPGGPTDILGRLVAAEMAKHLGQSVVVENRAGGDGAIGADYVAKSAPDGYNVCFCTTGAIVVLPLLDPKLPYDPGRDLAPVGQVYRSVSAFIARIDLPVATLAQLIAMARANPGKITFGTSANGSPQHIAGEMLKSLAGIDMLHVPFKGDQQVLNELLGGRIDVQVGTVFIADPQYRAGKIKVLAVTGQSRWSGWPEVPTVIESGFPGFEASGSLAGLNVAANTPAAVIDRLNAALIAALAAPIVIERFSNAGVVGVGSRPDAYGAFLVRERERFARIIRAAGAKRD